MGFITLLQRDQGEELLARKLEMQVQFYPIPE